MYYKQTYRYIHSRYSYIYKEINTVLIFLIKTLIYEAVNTYIFMHNVYTM